jgi:ribonuclease BN (tRNA processing enzyme)
MKRLFVLSFLLFVLMGIRCIAQTNRDEPAPHGTQILFLGTAGGPPLDEERSEPATLLIVDGRKYLIDCGIGTMQRMLQAAIPSEQVEQIFLSHLHSDHDLGLVDVMANDFFSLNSASARHMIQIFGPPQTKELVDTAFHFIAISVRPFAAQNPSAYKTNDGHLASPFVVHEVERVGTIFRDDRIRVIAAENTHYALMSVASRKQMKSYSYRFETAHGVIVFTGDTGPSDAVASLASGADVFVAEASSRDPEDLDRFVSLAATQNHWSPARTKAFHAHMQREHLDAASIGHLASKAHVGSVLLYHYRPQNKNDVAAYISGVKKYFAGPVFASADLDRYCLDATHGKGSGATFVVNPCREQSPAH